MKYLLLIGLLLSAPAYAEEPCVEIKEFGCEPWVTCMPVEGGWKWIKR